MDTKGTIQYRVLRNGIELAIYQVWIGSDGAVRLISNNPLVGPFVRLEDLEGKLSVFKESLSQPVIDFKDCNKT